MQNENPEDYVFAVWLAIRSVVDICKLDPELLPTRRLLFREMGNILFILPADLTNGWAGALIEATDALLFCVQAVARMVGVDPYGTNVVDVKEAVLTTPSIKIDDGEVHYLKQLSDSLYDRYKEIASTPTIKRHAWC